MGLYNRRHYPSFGSIGPRSVTWPHKQSPIFTHTDIGACRFVFGKFQTDLADNADKNPDVGTNARAIPTYLSLLIFGFVYQNVLVYDALQGQNTIQIIGLCIMNLGILVYTAIQRDQIHDATRQLFQHNLIEETYWADVQVYLIIIPCVIALGTALLGFIAWKLYDEFAWKIYKQISADLRLKRRYLIYQVRLPPLLPS